MSQPNRTVLVSFGIGACGVEQPERDERNKEESFFNQVACSYPVVGAGGRSVSPSRRLPEGTFINAWQSAMATTNNNTSRTGKPRSNSIARNDSGINRSRSDRAKEYQKQRSRSLQPQDSRTTVERENRTKKVKRYEEFVLPQYIGSHYEDKEQTSTPGKNSGRNNQKDEDQLERSGAICHHLRWLPHGAVSTILALMLAWAGLGLAVVSRQSLNFVSLETPWRISGIYEDVASLGVIHAGICYNETVSTIRDPSRVGCFTVPLATNGGDIDDPMFKVAAAFASVSTLLGFVLTLATTASLCWRTINFRALGVGYIFLYCFQSLTFLYFDTDLCEYHECKVDVGCMYCIAASICWISSCILCAKMESNRLKSDIAEERKKRKAAAAKAAVKKSSMVSRSGGTVISDRTSSTMSDELTVGVDEEVPVSMERTPRRHSTSGIDRQHESIITLDPKRRYSTGHTTVSELTLTSTVNTLNNRNRGRLEYQGKEVSKRGRSTSRSRGARGRSKSRGRSESATARTRSKSKQKHESSGQQYVGNTTAEKEQKQTTKRNERNVAVGPKVQSYYSSTEFANIPLSPSPPPGKNNQARENRDFVTSYFDI